VGCLEKHLEREIKTKIIGLILLTLTAGQASNVPYETIRQPNGTQVWSVQSRGHTILGEWHEFRSTGGDARHFWLWRPGQGYVQVPTDERFETLSNDGLWIVTSVQSEVRIRSVEEMFKKATPTQR